MKRNFFLVLFFPSILFSQENIKFSKTIVAEDLKQHLSVLASDSLEGRETGKPGQKMAADYIMNHFKNIGIPPYNKKTYYQKFKIKSENHICKYDCENCEEDFITKFFKKKRVVKG